MLHTHIYCYSTASNSLQLNSHNNAIQKHKQVRTYVISKKKTNNVHYNDRIYALLNRNFSGLSG